MTNKEKLQEFLKEQQIGCYDEKLELLNNNNLGKVIDGLEYGGDTDVHICINRKRYIVEIVRDGLDEIDFHVMTEKEYKALYGYED